MKSDLTDKIKQEFFQAVVVIVSLYGWTTWTLTKCLKTKLDKNYTRMLHAVLNKNLEAGPHKIAAVQLLTSHLPNHPSKMNKTC